MIKCLLYFPAILFLLITGCSSFSFTQKVNRSEENVFPTIKNFPFKVSIITPDGRKLKNEQYNIKIVNKVNNKIQIIEEGIPFKNSNVSDLLEIKDFNNDGYLDILASSMYPSLQLVDTLYLFNPEKQIFTNGMDNIPYEGTISITKPGCIKMEYIVRNGSNYLKPENFCWINNIWKSE